MVYKREDIIYVLTRDDVRMTAQALGIRKLTGEHYRMAQKYVEAFWGDGMYTWSDAITDVLKEVEDERRRTAQRAT